MKKYIDADVLIERIEKNEDLSWNLDKVSQAAFISILNHIPAVDVEPVRKWIPCIERLPEKFEECIVAKADSKGTTGAYYSRKTQKWMRDCWGRWAEMSDVVAWMPLPEPPKMEVENENNYQKSAERN